MRKELRFSGEHLEGNVVARLCDGQQPRYIGLERLDLCGIHVTRAREHWRA